MNLNVTIVRYNGTAVSGSGDYVGIANDGSNRKVRIAFTPAQPLSSIAFRVVGSTKSYADAKVLSYGIMTTEANAPASPYVASADWYTLPASTAGTIDKTVTVEADFVAGQTYYLWLWGAPGGGYAFITYSGITLTGAAVGLAHIDSGAVLEDYMPHIDNGAAFEEYIPYIDNGTTWDIMA